MASLLSPELQSFLSNMTSGGAGGADSNVVTRLIDEAKKRQFNASAPANAPGGIDTSTLDQLSQQNAQDPRSLVGGINDLAQPLLQKLGPIGSGISKGVDFLERVGDVGRGAAERGALNGLAPQFSSGIQGAAQREVESAYMRAQTNLAQAKTISEFAGPGASKPLTDMAKLQRDFENGTIRPDVYEAKLKELFAQETSRQFEQTRTLRNEFYDRIDPIVGSKQALAQASSLLATTDNPLADLAALISTIRSIDKSVVRGEELAAYESMLGIVSDIENAISKAGGKGFSPQTRANIASMMRALQTPLEEIEAGWRTFYREEAGKSQLDPDSIVGGPSPQINVPDIQKPEAIVPPSIPQVDPNSPVVGEI